MEEINKAFIYIGAFHFNAQTTNGQLTEYVNQIEIICSKAISLSNEIISKILAYIDFAIFKMKTEVIAHNRFAEIKRCEELQFHLRQTFYQNVLDNDKRELEEFMKLAAKFLN